MPGQKLFIENKHPGFYMDKYGIYVQIHTCMYVCTVHMNSIHFCMCM